KANQLGFEENEVTVLDEATKLNKATELDEVAELDEDIQINNTYKSLEDKENKYYTNKNDYINHLVESQEINIVSNNLKNMRLSEDNEEDSDLELRIGIVIHLTTYNHLFILYG
ncbi:17687_t:CDS:1, partial [Racocetra fulgida]